MVRARRGRTTRARRTPAERARRMSDNRLESPAIDWETAPERFKFPEISSLKNLEIGELAQLYQRFGIVAPWTQMRVATAAYVQRMTSIPPGSDAFKDEINRLLDTESKRGVLSMTRRAYREFTTIEGMQEDTTTEFIWISDGDDGTCERCSARGGDIGTIAYHAAQGLPGASTCSGGDMCRCQLVPVD